MVLFIFGLIVFLGVHSVSITNRNWRGKVVASMGERPWKGFYSPVTLAGLVMIIVGFGEANSHSILYYPPAWLRHLSLLLLLPVFPLLFAAYLPGRIKVWSRPLEIASAVLAVTV